MRFSLFIRSIRQVLPFLLALVGVSIKPSADAAFLGYGLASIIMAFLLVPVIGGRMSISLNRFRLVLGKYASGLRASLLLGCSNMLWLNGFIPFLNYLGMSALAGQYSILQRMLNAPLTLVTAVVNAYLIRRESALHLHPKSLVILAFALFGLGGLWSVMGYIAFYVQPFYEIPAEWKAPVYLYLAMCLFVSSSFALGALSVISIRLKDEWFLSIWQIALVVIGAVIMIYGRSSSALLMYLLVGGAAYWLLLIRWVSVSGSACKI